MVSKKREKAAVPASRKASSKGKKKSKRPQQKSSPAGVRERATEQKKRSGTPLKLEILPKEHIGSPFCDSRVYAPTVKEFMADTARGSMLDEVSLLPLDDLTSLMCGSTIYSLIKDTVVGAGLREACAKLQKKHALLNLRQIANEDTIRQRSLRLLRHEGCNAEFLTPSALSTYLELMLLSVIEKSSWKFDVEEFCHRLSQRLVSARRGRHLVDATFYRYKIYRLGQLYKEDFEDIQEQGKLTAEEVKQLLESLLANVLRFFVLYCVHGLRDQVSTKLSNTGEVMYRLKYPAEMSTVSTVAQSDEVLLKCTPLNDDSVPRLKDLLEKQFDGCPSLPYQITHLPAPQIVELVLGEALYSQISERFPAFLMHMEEYAALLKSLQSRFQHMRLSMKIRQRKGSKILSTTDVDSHLYMIFTMFQDWALLMKIKQLRVILRDNMRELKPGDYEQKLWSSRDCHHGPAKFYYPLSRFAKGPQSLPTDLLNRISLRFNHFILNYAVHVFREHIRVCENGDSLQFSVNPSLIEVKDQDDKPKTKKKKHQKVSQQASSQDTGAGSFAVPAEEPTYTSATGACVSSGIASYSVIVPTSTVDVKGSDYDKEEQDIPEPDTRSPVVPLKSSSAAVEGEDNWEMKLYERVKDDSSVPLYFKTTLGILVTNNRDLRKERAFLHSHLNHTDHETTA